MDKFKFKVTRLKKDNTIYTAIRGLDSYRITWNNGKEYTFYSIEDVEKYVREGTWTVIEEAM